MENIIIFYIVTNKKNKKFTYLSLFSSAGVGCYGFKESGFQCIATNELLAKRLKIQTFNKKCKYDTGYIGGSITDKNVKSQLFKELEFWKNKYKSCKIWS